VQKKSAAMGFLHNALIKTSTVGMLVLLLSVLLAVRFSRKITDPLIEIVNAAARVGQGNLDVKLPIKSANEVGILADNFNQMVTELRLHRDKLEHLVAERTAELNTANQNMQQINGELISANVELERTNTRLNDEIKARR